MNQREEVEALRKRLTDKLDYEIQQLSQQIKELQKARNDKASLLHEIEKVLAELR